MTGGACRKVKKQYGVVPTSVGASKNLLPVHEIETIQADGVSCERNDDGSIHVYGTATADNRFYFVKPKKLCSFSSGTYTMSIGSELPENVTVIFEYYDSTGSAWVGSYGSMSMYVPSRTVEIGDGQVLSLYFNVKAGNSVDFTIYPQLEAGSEATDYVPYGEVIEGRTRKIKKSYDVVGGVTRQFYSADFLAYDGAYTVSQVTYDGKLCNLYTLTGSGILTLNDDALFWMCGGGANGGSSSATTVTAVPTRGVGGGGGYIAEGSIAAGESWVVTVGAARGASSITDGTTTYSISGASGINGTSGGGGTHSGNGGTGTGKTTMPFGIASLGKHCAGGGSGNTANRYGSFDDAISVSNSTGYNGGSNGSAAPGTGGSNGGDKGGGNGGSARAPYTGSCSASKGGDASFYGSGGGGGGAYADDANNSKVSMSGGSGYQGVAYILDYKGGVPA